MQVKIEKTDKNNEIKLEITVESKEFINAMTKIFNQNAKYFSVPGFRKGKAPMNIVEKYYGSEIFYEDAFNNIFDETYPKVVEENKLEIMTKPEVEISQMEKGKDLIYVVTVGVKPEVKLGKYKGVEIEKAEYKVTEKDVDEELAKVQEKNARLISVENRAVKLGDTTIIDYEGFIEDEKSGNYKLAIVSNTLKRGDIIVSDSEGFVKNVKKKAFEGEKAENHELVIGSNTFIPGFEDQIIGMKIDDKKDIKVKFPDDYQSKDLAGKDAIFKVVLHEIKEKELPKLDDDFAKDVSEFDTLAEYRQDIKFKKEEQADEKAKTEMENAVVQKACENSEVEISDKMIDAELDNMIEDMDRRLSYQGLKLDQYLKFVGKTTKDFRDENRETAENSIKVRLVLEAICIDSKIEAEENEINEKIAELAKNYGKSEEELKKNSELKENIEITIKNEKAIKLLLDSSKKVAKKEEKNNSSDNKSKEQKEENKKTSKSKKAEDGK